MLGTAWPGHVGRSWTGTVQPLCTSHQEIPEYGALGNSMVAAKPGQWDHTGQSEVLWRARDCAVPVRCMAVRACSARCRDNASITTHQIAITVHIGVSI